MSGRLGRIITFYSYKGGTGRSLALANSAFILASSGYKVLVIDWDLEAPGLHRYFQPFLADPSLTQGIAHGVVDMMRAYLMELATPVDSRPKDWLSSLADLARWTVPLAWPSGGPLTFSNGGELQFIPAGRQSADYAENVNQFDWRRFYHESGGHTFLDAMRASMSQFDFTLIDSRTGVSDTSGICTIHLPDTVVLCYTYNFQSVTGVVETAEKIRSRKPKIATVPVAMRVEPQEDSLLQAMRSHARTRLVQFVPPSQLTSEYYFNRFEIRYLTKYAFFERISCFDPQPGAVDSLYLKFVELASLLANRHLEPELPQSGVRADVVRSLESAAEATPVSGPVLKPAPAYGKGRLLAAAVALLWAVLSLLPVARMPSSGLRKAEIILRQLGSESLTVGVPAVVSGPGAAIAMLTEAVGLPDPGPAMTADARKRLRALPPRAQVASSDFLSTRRHISVVVRCDRQSVEVIDPSNGKVIAFTRKFGGKCEIVGPNRILVNRTDQLVLLYWSPPTQPQTESDELGSWKAVWEIDCQQSPIESFIANESGSRGVVIYRGIFPNSITQGYTFDGDKFSVAGALRVQAGTSLARHGDDLYLVPPVVGVKVIHVGADFREIPIGGAENVRGSALVFGPGLVAFPFPTEIRVWSLKENRLVSSISSTFAQPLAFDSTGARLLLTDGTVRLVHDLRKIVDSVASAARYPGLSGQFFGEGDRYPLLAGSIYDLVRPRPDPNAPWNRLLKDVRQYTTLCLTPYERQQAFWETDRQAFEKYAACEASQGRASTSDPYSPRKGANNAPTPTPIYPR